MSPLSLYHIKTKLTDFDQDHPDELQDDKGLIVVSQDKKVNLQNLPSASAHPQRLKKAFCGVLIWDPTGRLIGVERW